MTALLVRTVVMYAVVVLAMRLMGKRQLGELQPAELVTTFLISNVASICIEEPELPLLASLLPVLLIAVLEILNSAAAWLFPQYARLLFGHPVTVIRKGTVDIKALSRLRISAGDLMEALRGKDTFSPTDIDWGVVETDGTLNLAPKAQNGQSAAMLPLLIDSHCYTDNLVALGLDLPWLWQQLQNKNLRERDVLIYLYNGTEEFILTKKDCPNGQS